VSATVEKSRAYGPRQHPPRLGDWQLVVLDAAVACGVVSDEELAELTTAQQRARLAARLVQHAFSDFDAAAALADARDGRGRALC
jgi:hypothetical protein